MVSAPGTRKTGLYGCRVLKTAAEERTAGPFAAELTKMEWVSSRPGACRA